MAASKAVSCGKLARQIFIPQRSLFACKCLQGPGLSRGLGMSTAGKEGVAAGTGLASQVLQARLSQEDEKKGKFSEEEGKESEEDKKKREAAWKAMKYTFIAFGVSFGGLGTYLFIEWGSPKKDEDGKIIYDEFSHMPLIKQYLLRCWNEVLFYNKMIQEPSREKLLPEPLSHPFIQPPYTVVLELNGVLIHPDWTYKTGWRFKKRPGVDYFLSQIGPPTFEVVIYTAMQAYTAFPIVDALDQQNTSIMYRLFRDATRYTNGHHVKDLDCLNRDLSKVIVVDWNNNSVKLHNRNSIVLKKWEGADDDRQLYDLAMLLRAIAMSEVEDVREVLDFYSKHDDPILAFKENQRRLQEQQEQMLKLQQEKQEKTRSLTTGWTPSFFSRKRS